MDDGSDDEMNSLLAPLALSAATPPPGADDDGAPHVSARELLLQSGSQLGLDVDLEECERGERERVLQHLQASRIYCESVFSLNVARAQSDWLFALFFCYGHCAATLDADLVSLAQLVLEKHLIGTLDPATRAFAPPAAAGWRAPPRGAAVAPRTPLETVGFRPPSLPPRVRLAVRRG